MKAIALLAALTLAGCGGGWHPIGGGTLPLSPGNGAYHAFVVIGQGRVSPIYGTALAGSTVSITATPAAGWRFDHWEGDVRQQDIVSPAITLTLVKGSTLNVQAFFAQVAGG